MRIQRIAEQLLNTNAFLDRYTRLLSKSEAITRVLFDEEFTGAEDVRPNTQSFIASFLSLILVAHPSLG